MNKQPIDLSLLDGVLEEYASVKGSLITILQNTQDIYGYLPREAVELISEKTGLISTLFEVNCIEAIPRFESGKINYKQLN